MIRIWKPLLDFQWANQCTCVGIPLTQAYDKLSQEIQHKQWTHLFGEIEMQQRETMMEFSQSWEALERVHNMPPFSHVLLKWWVGTSGWDTFRKLYKKRKAVRRICNDWLDVDHLNQTTATLRVVGSVFNDM